MLELNSLIAKLTVNPYKILSLKAPSIQKGMIANLTIFDVLTEWTFAETQSLSKSTNSPFLGWKLKGKPFAVINNNQFFVSIL
jgi:dihydroorotase